MAAKRPEDLLLCQCSVGGLPRGPNPVVSRTVGRSGGTVGVRRTVLLARESSLSEIGVTSIFTDAITGRNPDESPTCPRTIA